MAELKLPELAEGVNEACVSFGILKKETRLKKAMR